jgi:hypothetical protein
VLEISFEGLDKAEKEIFLHIACFFNSVDADYVKNVLNCCGFHADIGLRVLIDKSLIRIIDEHIRMHNLLEELGRKIVQENSSKELRKWKRLWSKEQFHHVMSDHMVKQLFGYKKLISIFKKQNVLKVFFFLFIFCYALGKEC